MPKHSPSDLDTHQNLAIDWLKYRTEAMVALPIGFGKTIVTLTAILEVLRVHPDWRVLVVSTNAIIKHTWGDEIANWTHTEHLEYGDASGGNKSVIRSVPKVLGVNFESLVGFLNMLDDEPELCPEILVIDEFSKMKAPDANRFKVLAGGRRIDKDGGVTKYTTLPGHLHRFERRFELSGTPAPEGYANLWAPSCLLGTRRRLGENITSFRKEYCTVDYDGFGWRVIPALEAVIEEKLKHVMYLPDKADDYLALPPVLHRALDVPWTEDARAQYDEMENELALSLDDLDPDMSLDELEIEAPNAGVKLIKLRQICSGFIYDQQKETHWLDDWGAKLDAVSLVLDECADTPLLVFTQFKAEQYLLESELGFHIGLPADLEQWNTGNIPRLAIHPASAGHGLNLQYGSHVCLYYSLPYSFEQWSQSFGRLHRRGQVRQVSALRLERTNSIESDIWDTVQRKGAKL